MSTSVPARRLGVSVFMVLLVLMLYGINPADSSPQAQVRPTPTTPSPRPTPTTPGPRPTQPSQSPRPTPTDPYPAGAGLPQAPDAAMFFPVGDAEPTERSSAVGTLLWIFLAVAAMGLTLRWFLLAAREDRSG